MRKILISLLMASAAMTPSVAYAQDSAAERRAARQQARADRDAAREERSSAREEQAAPREERAARQDRAVHREEGANQRAIQVERAQVGAPAGAGERDARRQQRVTNQAERAEDRAARQAQYAAIREARRNAGPPPISRTPQPNTQPPPPVTSRPTTTPRWNTNWRHSGRYDWNNYRRKNRWLFNLGYYYDPFGWGYSPYSIGWRMWPSYFGSRYWLNDPWQYRLPYAPPGTRWIRYYDDAVLVDTWSGQVVDVIYSFFW